LQGSIP